MACLAVKNGAFLARFRYRGKAYKKSLRTRNAADAKAALCIIELMLHRLVTGQATIPAEVDAGDFIVSGGTLTAPPPEESPKPPALTFTQLVNAYLTDQQHRIAETYRQCQATHLRHLVRHLGQQAELSCTQITANDLDNFVRQRLAIRHGNTVCREICTLQQIFQWSVEKKHLPVSPAAGLKAIKASVDQLPFRTVQEVKEILDRGGLNEAEQKELWECLYLAPEEIATLLATVRENGNLEASYLLHAVPAYTGMRRGELLRLKWMDIDFDSDCITVRSRKQSRSRRETIRHVDLHPDLRRELVKWRGARPKGQWVVSRDSGQTPLEKDRANRWFWQPLRKTTWCLNSRRNWLKVGFHTYRHSFASNLAGMGVDQRIIDEWMGHQTEEMRKRYRHLFPKNRRSAINRLEYVQAERTNKS